MEEVRENMLARAKEVRNPFNFTSFDEVAPVISGTCLGGPGRVGSRIQRVGRTV